MAGFSQDLPISFASLSSTSPQPMFQRLNTTSTTTSSSSSSEIDIMRNRVLQMQALVLNEKEVNILNDIVESYSFNFLFFLINSRLTIGVVKQKKVTDLLYNLNKKEIVRHNNEMKLYVK